MADSRGQQCDTEGFAAQCVVFSDIATKYAFQCADSKESG